MQIQLEILRRESAAQEPWVQCIPFETEDAGATAASALTQINSAPDIRDADGNPVTPIRWECSCLQKKCGACAMVINGRPCLACDAKLAEVQRGGIVRLEPLRKFPVIADLIADRSILLTNLKIMHLWLEEQTRAEGKTAELTYEASRCLQCGCCLEICPNFCEGEDFFGMAAFVPAARLISELPDAQKKALYADYRKHIYAGCGKSLACRSVCPAGLDIDHLLVNTNAAAVWKRPFGRKK